MSLQGFLNDIIRTTQPGSRSEGPRAGRGSEVEFDAC